MIDATRAELRTRWFQVAVIDADPRDTTTSSRTVRFRAMRLLPQNGYRFMLSQP